MDSLDQQQNSQLFQAFARCARGESTDILAHIEKSNVSVTVEGTLTIAHSYYLKENGNGQFVTTELAEFMAEQIVNYAIPRQRIAEAHEQYTKNKDSGLSVRLANEARELFLNSKTSGEAGELLLFLFAERIFKFPQLMTKMSLKTSGEMHYHGADGVFAELRDDGGLNLYWGEAKLHKSVSSAIKGAFSSLAPYLAESRNRTSKRSQDLFLLKSNLDLDDQILTNKIKLFFERNSDQGRAVKYCGFSIVGYDSKIYEDAVTKTLDIATRATNDLAKQLPKIKKSIFTNDIIEFNIHIICLPFKSVQEFRDEFAKKIGILNDTR